LKPEAVAEQLCLKCGLCCNGVLFKDVELQSGDNPARLKALGLELRRRRSHQASTAGSASSSSREKVRLIQPCSALGSDNYCRCYQERPIRCRQFECALFKAVANDRVESAQALRVIQRARRLAEKVRRLLRQLGDTDEHVPLTRRFNGVRRRTESNPVSAEDASLFGDLTIAVHELNVVLSEEFYPGR
jgi:Fe-S-cluster containining protein